MKSILLLLLALLLSLQGFCQCAIAITIDDVPNTRQYMDDNDRTILLEKIDSISIPVTIFINESLVYATDRTDNNLAALDRWAGTRYITLGTHTYSHLWYSATDYPKFREDYLKGMTLTSELAAKYNKPLKYFRFPYNDLGIDSVQHVRAAEMVSEENNIIAPFTVSSSDYAFNSVYSYYLKAGESQKALEIAERYINTTLEYFSFMDSLSVTMYGRHMNQVYLCHDNALNSRYLSVLVSRLKERGFSFISLDEAMADEAYHQEDTYYYKWGVSWFYRWMKDHERRKTLMRLEPDMREIEEAYEHLEQ